MALGTTAQLEMLWPEGHLALCDVPFVPIFFCAMEENGRIMTAERPGILPSTMAMLGYPPRSQEVDKVTPS